MTKDINVLALVKGEERYIFLYDDARRAQTLRMLGKYASDPDLSFTWYDAAVLSQKIRQSAKEQQHSDDLASDDAATSAESDSSTRFTLPLPTDRDE